MSEQQTPEQETPKEPEGDKGKSDQTFTQADIDRIVSDRIKREREKYADYDDLKAKAEGAKTAEERIAALENEIETQRLTATKARIATEFGLTEKQAAALKYAPSEEAARELARDLAAETSERMQSNNVSPREGNHSKPANNDMRAFAKQLFQSAD